MRNTFYVLLLLSMFTPSLVYAQDEKAQPVPTDVIQEYLDETVNYSVVYSGRAEEPYYVNLVNHPFLKTDEFMPGTLCYNDVIYTNVQLRYNTHREQVIVRLKNFSLSIELNTDRVNWAQFNGYRVIAAKELDWENLPSHTYLIIIHDGAYPVFKYEKTMLNNRIVDRVVEYSFGKRLQYYINVGGRCYPLKNKKSILNLFPEKRRELDQYAKDMKLNFRRDPEESFVKLINYYEELMK